MVLSAIMQLPYVLSLLYHPHQGLPLPISWVLALGDLRSLLYDASLVPRLFVPLPLPFPADWDDPPFFDCLGWPPDLAPDGEGEALFIVNQEQAHEAMEDFNFVTGCSWQMLEALEQWSDLPNHVTACNFGAVSFGPLGLFSSEGDNLGASAAEGADQMGKAVVDTGASLTISAFRDDFIYYEKKEGLVIHGLTKGAPIMGIGVVLWHMEVGDTIILVKI